MFKVNKYSRWYYGIINGAKALPRSKKDGYFESHHIIPRCLGGTDINTNLVLLTAREHFIVHLLLVRMVDTKIVYKMVHAVIRFSSGARNAREYELLRATISRFSKGEYNNSYGKKWVHHPDTGDIKYVKPEVIEEGYIIGLPYQRGGVASTGLKYRWVNNGIQESMIPANSEIREGWFLGKLSAPQLPHMIKMARERHTPEKDKEHSEKMKGRITVSKTDTKDMKRIKPIDLDKYLADGYINHSECSIEGVIYISTDDAAKQMGLSVVNLRLRLRSQNPKWSEWKLTNDRYGKLKSTRY